MSRLLPGPVLNPEGDSERAREGAPDVDANMIAHVEGRSQSRRRRSEGSGAMLCQSEHRIDQNSQLETAQHTCSTRGLGLLLRLGQFGEDTSLAFLPQPIALAADVDRRREVQQPVQDGRCKYLVGEDVAPVAIGLVRGEDD